MLCVRKKSGMSRDKTVLGEKVAGGGPDWAGAGREGLEGRAKMGAGAGQGRGAEMGAGGAGKGGVGGRVCSYIKLFVGKGRMLLRKGELCPLVTLRRHFEAHLHAEHSIQFGLWAGRDARLAGHVPCCHVPHADKDRLSQGPGRPVQAYLRAIEREKEKETNKGKNSGSLEEV